MSPTAASRRATKRRPALPARRRTAEPLPKAPPEQRIWLLDLPFGMRPTAVKYVKQWRSMVYVGPALPAELEHYRTKAYTVRRWREDMINGHPGPPPSPVARRTPRPDQFDMAQIIAEAAASQLRGFLLAAEPGWGKTIPAVLAARLICKIRHQDTVLVIADRPAEITIGHWRSTISSIGDGHLNWVICSPDGLRHLLTPNGRPALTPAVIIADEAQNFRHVQSQRTQLMQRVARFQAPHTSAPFLLAVTATPGHTPAEQTYLAPLFAQLNGDHTTSWTDLGGRLAELGFPLTKGPYGRWTWNEKAAASGKVQRKAADHIRHWMTDHQPPAMAYRPSPQGHAPIDGLPVELSAAQWISYQQQWGDFQREMGLARHGKAVARGRAALVRFRQKAGLLRAEATAQWAAAQVAASRQVIISVAFIDTAADPIAAQLEAADIPYARIDGATPNRESERQRFQRGHAKVMITTITASISLHAHEHLDDGTTGSAAPRVGIVHNARYSGIEFRQITGRSHRDGQISEWWVPYAENTVEAQAAEVMIERARAATDSAGGDTSSLHKIAKLYGADWLPTDVWADTDSTA